MKLRLYTERIVTDLTIFEIPDNFDLDKFLKENSAIDLLNIGEIYNISENLNWDEFEGDYYRLESENGEILDEW